MNETPNKLTIDRSLLEAAKEKLEIYRSQHSGEYSGGWEYTRLITEIERTLAQGNTRNDG